ncbi:hypothetical protein KFL_008020020 [Klebsormidium nitens]|uniref:E2F-associated phosphoprotein n=1 Tax=Klebsormidium nitens TaxID=105231 RepID=A0A1Y1IN47_KLENI|nr:hypothetical protein KFL_008020020 [Klebsormidium nitens]|eukprot:GAQ91532.1 hypothetical protein KFL_008020020 [Klebsormidium nitens]
MWGGRGKEAENGESMPKLGKTDEPLQAADGDRSEGAAMDSSEDEGETGASEAAYYDPEADDHDENWATAQRTGRVSDAVLSCPACFATLCIDCQQHELYSNQFRAMFVTNCKVKEGEVLRAPPQAGKRRRGRRRGQEDGSVPSPGAQATEVFSPVECADCGTEVAVLDSDEVYHFFNVLPTMA